MAPLAARTPSNDASNDGAADGMPPFVIVAIIVSILLGGLALSAFWIFGNRTYRALVQWWESRKTVSSVPSTPTVLESARRSRGGVTHPTASIPRFAHNVSAALHLPRPKTSLQASRPMSSVRAYPTGMGPSHSRRGSEASMNSTAGLLRAAAPPSPKPAFVRGGIATGQGSTR